MMIPSPWRAGVVPLSGPYAHLSWPDLDVEVVPLVGDLEDLGPGEPVDAQPVSVDEQPASTHPQHDLHTLRVLDNTHTHTLA